MKRKELDNSDWAWFAFVTQPEEDKVAKFGDLPFETQKQILSKFSARQRRDWWRKIDPKVKKTYDDAVNKEASEAMRFPRKRKSVLSDFDRRTSGSGISTDAQQQDQKSNPHMQLPTQISVENPKNENEYLRKAIENAEKDYNLLSFKDFGIDGDFNQNKYDHGKLKASQRIINFWQLYFLVAVAFFLMTLIFGNGYYNVNIFIMLLIISLGLSLGIFFNLPFKRDEYFDKNSLKYEKYLKEKNARKQSIAELYSKYEVLKKKITAAEEARVRKRLMQRRASWTDLRGVEFEIKLAQLFRDAGCTVDETSASGDGGVDLVVKTSIDEYWVQAKGHAAPVGVTTIREIAGVCSVVNAKPVMAVVNGYTEAALKAGEQLGVTLLDTDDLIKISEMKAIKSL